MIRNSSGPVYALIDGTVGVEIDGFLNLAARGGRDDEKSRDDGRDEMGKAVGERAALVAYLRLGIESEIPRLLVSCRAHYFYSGSGQREFLAIDVTRQIF